MSFTYIQIDERIEAKIITKWGDWVKEEFPKGEGCYAVAALMGDEVVGFATLGPRKFIPPLEEYRDAFIQSIEVDEQFQRRGIGSALVGMLESWAKAYGYRQIRAWSSQDKTSALHMWYALNYCMCPAVMLGVSVKTGDPSEKVVGYYYAKMLNPIE